MKKIYTYKTKPGAAKVMAQVLKFPEQVDNRMDEKVCRITETSYTINANIKQTFQEQCKNEHLYQIKVIDISEKEFLIFESLLDSLNEVIVVQE